ncbi:MAG: AAA family ATPase [Ignavibacteriaceae bacterium]|nr:AAA family ATPase [Ignavibacteriaceae bacterium]
MDFYSLDHLLKDKSERPIDLIGDGILINKSLLLITGAKKARKTFLAYNLGIALAAGGSFGGFIIPQVKNRVLILSAEGGYFPNRERIQNMCKWIDDESRKKLDINLEVCFDPRIKLEDEADYKLLSNKIEKYKPSVVIIDPFVKFHQLEENDASDMGIILGRLRNLIEDFNTAIILVHHLGKDPNHCARGSSAILGEYDSCITISKVGGDEKCKHRIEFDLRHAISPDPKVIIFDKESFWFYEDISPIASLVKEHGHLNKQDLVELIVEQGLYKKSGAYKAVNRLVTSGELKLNSDELYEIVQK